MHAPSGEVLVVDDDADMAEVMEMILSEAGYRVRSARNGKEALEAVAARRPDLVLLDMIMPVMDGWQCARELRVRYGRAVPIVIVTAAEHARARAEEVGSDGVLSKPFDLGHFLRTVNQQVATRSSARPG